MSDTPETDKPQSTELSDNELGDASGGNFMMGMPHHLNIFQRFTLGHSIRPSSQILKVINLASISGIKGPSWVNLMTYRKPGAASEPSTGKSVTELFAELSAEETAQA